MSRIIATSPRLRLTANAHDPYHHHMVEIEEKIAHLTRTVDDLSDIVARQETEIAMLTRRVQLLLEREAAREAADTNAEIIADVRPPHW